MFYLFFFQIKRFAVHGMELYFIVQSTEFKKKVLCITNASSFVINDDLPPVC